MASPPIVTLRPDPASQERFQTERDFWFPPERNVVPAHLMLFHHLSGDRRRDRAARLADVAAAAMSLALRVAGLLSLGRGVAFDLEVPGGRALRDRI